MSQAQLAEDCEFNGVSFKSCDMRGISFDGQVFVDVKFDNADLANIYKGHGSAGMNHCLSVVAIPMKSVNFGRLN